MKRKSTKEEFNIETSKMPRLEIAADLDSSLMVASGSDVSKALVKHFNYKISDKTAKSNLLKAAARDIFEISEMQKCTMILFNVASYLQIVMPIVIAWKNCEQTFQTENMEIHIKDVIPGYDASKKHMETLIKFLVNGNKISVTCYNSTQKVKVEGQGYQEFMKGFIQPIFDKGIRDVDPYLLEKYNKEVIAMLSGKRKAISRPVRSVRYKAMAKMHCKKCDGTFLNNTQLNRHKKAIHSEEMNNSSPNMTSFPIVEDLYLFDSESDTMDETETITVTLEETSATLLEIPNS